MAADTALLTVIPESSLAPAPSMPIPLARADAVSFEQLFRRHYPELVRVARALGVEPGAAEDLAQEAFVVAHTKLEREGIGSNPRAWLYSIARRLAANHRRSRRRARAREDAAPAPTESHTPEELTQRRQAAQILQRFLDDLPTQQREAFVLYELEGLNAPQVQEILGISTETVHARVRLARGKFKRVLERLDAQRRRGERSA